MSSRLLTQATTRLSTMAPPPPVDAAIVDALGLDPASTSIASHGASGFASSFKLSTTVKGEPVNYFVKTGTGPEAEVMFKGEDETRSPGPHPAGGWGGGLPPVHGRLY